MQWWQFALLGAGGGAIVEVLAGFRCVALWQEARRSKDGTLKRTPPKLGRYLDLPGHAIMLPARMALGAVAAVLFGLTGQVTGPYGAVAFGCAAPVLLTQIGLIPQVSNAVKGESKTRQNQVEQSTPVTAGAQVEESQLG